MAEFELPILGPPPPPPAAVAVVDRGYENVRVVETGKAITVWYENRRFFNALDGLAEVLAIVAPLATPDASLNLIPLRDDQPLLELETTPRAVMGAATKGGRLEARILPPRNPPFDPLAPTANRADMTLQPALRFDQLSYSYLARADIAAPIGNGLRGVARLQAPVYPQFGFDPPTLALRSSGWMAPDVPAVFQVGTSANRAHLAGEVAYQVLGGYGFLKVKGALVQDAFPEFVAKAEARVPIWDLTLAGGWGQWPLGDWGPFFSVRRRFDRTMVEATVTKTHYGTQFRGTLGINLGFDPKPAPGTLRILPIGYYQMSYYATAYSAADPIQPDPEVDDFQDRLTPAFLEAHLSSLPWPEGSRDAPATPMPPVPSAPEVSSPPGPEGPGPRARTAH